ncbi:hypothetical protein [Bacillus kwashiorkori]|uniref:hypothetical protein n=1 Tax=Bacillus kwashiorkori TaxID=1522318 RepID=UPI000780CC9E|nr:hypothetical protein [Bacillus kwashiorkori]
MKKLIQVGCVLFFTIFCTSCFSKEGEKFLESSKTQEEAKAMVKQALLNLGLDVEIGEEKVDYTTGFKRRNEGEIAVYYSTRNIPYYQNHAIVTVDTENKPRKLSKVSSIGLIKNSHGYGLDDAVIGHLYPIAFQTGFQRAINHSLDPQLKFVKNEAVDNMFGIYMFFYLNKDRFFEQHLLPDFLKNYRNNDFANPTEEDAKSFIEKYMILQVDEEKNQEFTPKIHLHYEYNGTFSNEKMDQFLDELLAIKELANGLYYIEVSATSYVQDNYYPNYNKDIYGNYSSLFKANLYVKGKDIRLKNGQDIFEINGEFVPK